MPLLPCRADGGAGVTEIVGLSCAYPGAAAADSVSGFWGAAVAGTDLPTDIPYDRRAIERHYSPDVTGGLALPGFVEHVLPWLLWLAGGSFLGGNALNTHTPQLQPFNISTLRPLCALFSAFAISLLAVEKMYVRFASFIPGVDTFDAAMFRWAVLRHASLT